MAELDNKIHGRIHHPSGGTITWYLDDDSTVFVEMDGPKRGIFKATLSNNTWCAFFTILMAKDNAELLEIPQMIALREELERELIDAGLCYEHASGTIALFI